MPTNYPMQLAKFNSESQVSILINRCFSVEFLTYKIDTAKKICQIAKFKSPPNIPHIYGCSSIQQQYVIDKYDFYGATVPLGAVVRASLYKREQVKNIMQTTVAYSQVQLSDYVQINKLYCLQNFQLISEPVENLLTMFPKVVQLKLP